MERNGGTEPPHLTSDHHTRVVAVVSPAAAYGVISLAPVEGIPNLVGTAPTTSATGGKWLLLSYAHGRMLTVVCLQTETEIVRGQIRRAGSTATSDQLKRRTCWWPPRS